MELIIYSKLDTLADITKNFPPFLPGDVLIVDETINKEGSPERALEIGFLHARLSPYDFNISNEDGKIIVRINHLLNFEIPLTDKCLFDFYGINYLHRYLQFHEN